MNENSPSANDRQSTESTDKTTVTNASPVQDTIQRSTQQSTRRQDILKTLLIITVVTLGTIGILVAAGVGFAVWGVVSMANGCKQTEANTHQNAATLQFDASTLKIDGVVPVSVKDVTTGDCLTNANHRAVAEATFQLMEPDVAAANAHVAQSLHLATPTSQLFNLETDTTGGAYRGTDLYTQFPESNNRYYDAYFYFDVPYDCSGVNTGRCNHPVVGSTLFAGRAINKIVVDVSNRPFYPSLAM